MPTISPSHVLRLARVTEDYLCPPEANVYGIDFTRFKIRDIDSKTTLFEIAKPPPGAQDDESEEDSEDVDPNAGRFVRYQFTPQVNISYSQSIIHPGYINNTRKGVTNFLHNHSSGWLMVPFGKSIPFVSNKLQVTPSLLLTLPALISCARSITKESHFCGGSQEATPTPFTICFIQTLRRNINDCCKYSSVGDCAPDEDGIVLVPPTAQNFLSLLQCSNLGLPL